jgi:hypothetical protein
MCEIGKWFFFGWSSYSHFNNLKKLHKGAKKEEEVEETKAELKLEPE